MTKSRRSLVLAVTLAAAVLAACGTAPGGGGTPPPPPPGGGGGGGTAGDTAGYHGRLVWSTWNLFSVPYFRVWDMPTSSFIAQRDASNDPAQILPDATVSPDGSLAAYAVLQGAPVSKDYDEHAIVVDLATGTGTAATVSAPSPDVEVYTRQPSISSTGQVALEIHSATYDPTGSTLPVFSDTDVALWTPGSGEPAVIPGASDPADDTCPTITADGSSVVFSSDRDGPKDFYRVPATGGTVERLTYTVDADILYVQSGPFGCDFVLSDDGGRLMFEGHVTGGNRLYLMDTTTGTVQEVGTGAKGKVADATWDMSADGSTLAFLTLEELNGGTDGRLRLYRENLDSLAPPTIITANLLSDPQRFDLTTATRPALARDGSEVAYIGLDTEAPEGLYGLFVRGSDGADPRLVTNALDDIVLGALDMTF